MKNLNIKNTVLCLTMLLMTVSLSAQVIFGGSSKEDGAIFELESTDKGLMLPRVALTSRTDVTTIAAPSTPEGLWVYNTADAGSGLDRVCPGFYFWDSSKWVRIYNDGYSVQFEQTETQRSDDDTTIYTLPGLDQDIVAPYTGTYEIHVSGYIACPNAIGSDEAMVHGSYFLEIDNVKVAESNVMSSTKKTPSAFQALGQQTTIIYYVDLSAGTTYNFKVRTRQWQEVNVDSGSLSSIYPGNYAFWGISSVPYNGNDLGVANAQDAYLTITLLRQY